MGQHFVAAITAFDQSWNLQTHGLRFSFSRSCFRYFSLWYCHRSLPVK